MTVTPFENEPGRFWVTSESEPDGPPHLVDLHDPDHGGLPYCSCAIIHNRTDAAAMCKHIRAVQASYRPMKALSIRQPWAWLIVNGFKDIENRTWPTHFRGNVLIHASKGMTDREYQDARAFMAADLRLVKAHVALPKPDTLPRGGIIGIATLDDCVGHSASPWFVGPYGFVLSHSYPLPFRACPGALGFFHFPP